MAREQVSVESVNPTAPDEGAPRSPEPADVPRLAPGANVGSRFVIDEWLHDDAVGAVYRAVDEKSGKKLALVMLAPELAADKAAVERLRRSVKVATGLAHKNIAAVFGMGKEGTRRYLAREHVDGQTLAALLDRKARAGKTFTLKGAYNLVAHLCNALQYAARTTAHGTLRPACVLISRSGRVKVADFGLGELRGALRCRSDVLTPWDVPCLGDDEPAEEGGPYEPRTADDLYALGVILYELLVGAPPAARPPVLPDDVAGRLPDALGDVLGRCFVPADEGGFRDPNELKTELLQVIEAARGAEPRPRAADARPGSSPPPSAHEAASPPSTPAAAPPPPPIGDPAPRKKAPARPRRDEGGFVIPELKPAAGADDDGTTARWLIERDGVDYGPFTKPQVIDKLFADELTADTNLYDIETDRRAPLSEFTAFDDALVRWAHENAEREKRRAEESVRAAARRRQRMLWGTVLGLLLIIGGTAGGYAWYRATRPEPQKAYLPSLVTRLHGALPPVELPVAAPETPAEREERRRRAAEARATRRAQAEARRAAAEARRAATSALDLAAGGGRRFDRAAFHSAVASRNAQLMRCLQAEARRDPSLKRLEVKITVVPSGDLINVRIPRGTPAGNACARSALAGLSVPPFDGTNLTISLPFSFRK